jgi:hypothetical protein
LKTNGQKNSQTFLQESKEMITDRFGITAQAGAHWEQQGLLHHFLIALQALFLHRQLHRDHHQAAEEVGSPAAVEEEAVGVDGNS